MADEETANPLAKPSTPARRGGQRPPPLPASEPEDVQRAADVETLIRRLAGKPAAEALSRLSNGDPLRLHPRCARRIRETYFVLDPDRVFERALVLVASGMEQEPERCTGQEWLVARIDRAIRAVLELDRDQERSGIPPEHPEEHFRLFVEAFFVEPPLARLPSVRLNGLDERIRKGFYKLLLDGLPLEDCLAMGLGPPERLQLDILLALQAIGLLDDAGVEELRWKGEKP
jgi:hypothetical protein